MQLSSADLAHQLEGEPPKQAVHGDMSVSSSVVRLDERGARLTSALGAGYGWPLVPSDRLVQYGYLCNTATWCNTRYGWTLPELSALAPSNNISTLPSTLGVQLLTQRAPRGATAVALDGEDVAALGSDSVLHMSMHMSGHMSEHRLERMSEHMSEHMPEHMPEHMSEHMPRHMSEHNV